MSTSINQIFQKENLSLPNNKHEDWLYYDIDKLIAHTFSEETTTTKRAIKSEFFLYFFNGKLIEQNLPNGVTIKEKNITPTETKNSFIHHAVNNSGNEISCTEIINDPITLIHENNQNSLSTNAIEINCDTNSKLHINRIFYAPENSCITSYTSININNNSKVIITDTNNNNQGTILDFIDARLQTNSKLFTLNQSYLSNNSRFQNRVFIDGSESNATLHGLAINETKQSCFYNTHIYHDAENSESHQLFKSMVKQNATLEYNGKVTVCPHAQQTNSYQLNQNILLDDYANVYSRPQLFIDADDVKCTHGSTTGDINKHEVLYLMSRGLDELTSRKIVLNAFFEEVFNKDEFKSEQQDVHQILNKIL